MLTYPNLKNSYQQPLTLVITYMSYLILLWLIPLKHKNKLLYFSKGQQTVWTTFLHQKIGKTTSRTVNKSFFTVSTDPGSQVHDFRKGRGEKGSRSPYLCDPSETHSSIGNDKTLHLTKIHSNTFFLNYWVLAGWLFFFLSVLQNFSAFLWQSKKISLTRVQRNTLAKRNIFKAIILIKTINNEQVQVKANIFRNNIWTYRYKFMTWHIFRTAKMDYVLWTTFLHKSTYLGLKGTYSIYLGTR